MLLRWCHGGRTLAPVLLRLWNWGVRPVCRDDAVCRPVLGGLQRRLSRPQRTVSHRRPHEAAVDRARHRLRRPDGRLRMDGLEIGAAQPCPARRGRAGGGAHRVRAILAAHAPACGTRRRRRHADRHAAPRVVGGDRCLFHAHCRLRGSSAREAIPRLLHRHDGDRPRVRRGDGNVRFTGSG